MAIEIIPQVLGPLENNSYLVADTQTGEAVVIDPSFGIEKLITQAQAKSWKIQSVWVTHAHFDHIIGASEIARQTDVPLQIYLHQDDLALWDRGGEGLHFDIEIDPNIKPTHLLNHGQSIRLGDAHFEVRHTPGHTGGHVIYYNKDIAAAFCGDLIFYHGIGRTDLQGGDYNTLIDSIQTQVFTLQPNTILFCGHGRETTVIEEMNFNPFLPGISNQR